MIFFLIVLMFETQLRWDSNQGNFRTRPTSNPLTDEDAGRREGDSCEEEPLIMYPTMYSPTVHRSVRCLLCWDTGRPLSDIWSAFEYVYSRQGPTLFRGPG
jgi:hypothetical protein